MPDVGGDACKAISQSREGNATAMVFPSACLFSPGATTVSESARSRSTIAEIARELSGVKDREFWIASRAPRTREAERVNSARAGALVSALIGAGVAANRLAAIVGVGFGEAGSSDSDPTGTALPPALAGAPVIEIVAAPAPMLLR
ncbi:MAG: hypothetical protein H7X95_01850 [Deltaproteobacteria bacterium]|nr:hypothetical protein [Deltaproteobacteria bacterium]